MLGRLIISPERDPAGVSVTVRLPKAPIEIDILYHCLGLAHGDQTGTAFKHIDILKNRHDARGPSRRAIHTEAFSGRDVLHKALSIWGVNGEEIRPPAVIAHTEGLSISMRSVEAKSRQHCKDG